jgi:GABA(A) receptor-associated protein
MSAPRISPSELQNIKERYPGRIPVFVLKARGTSADLPDLEKKKFLVPMSLTMGQLIYIVRQRMKLTPEKALFLFVGNSLPTTSTLVSDVYAAHASDDGALRIYYSSESVFGC